MSESTGLHTHLQCLQTDMGCRYEESLQGNIHCRSSQAFQDTVQTLHRIVVMCADQGLTVHNFQDFMRCDCKAYWHGRICHHIVGLAHWWVQAITLHSCWLTLCHCRYDTGFLDTAKLTTALPVTTKTGRKRKATAGLVAQPESPQRQLKAKKQQQGSASNNPPESPKQPELVATRQRPKRQCKRNV